MSQVIDFEKIYNETYKDALKYIASKCSNINDVNDILQETYIEFWKILNKKVITDENIKGYILKIASNKIKKHYSLLDKMKMLVAGKENEFEDIELIQDLELDKYIQDRDTTLKMWEMIKQYKNPLVSKVFFLYFYMDMKIKDIAEELNISESNVKNLLYRGIKKLKDEFGKED